MFARYFAVFFPIYFLSVWFFVSYIIGWIGGWHLLAQRFRIDNEFSGTLCRWFNATMRWGVHYNGALKAGADLEALYLMPLFVFRFGHPPLSIPWNEIRLESSRWYDFYLSVTLTLGNEEHVPFRISRRTARKLRLQAGASWPDSKSRMEL